jgi:hypothetical protein
MAIAPKLAVSFSGVKQSRRIEMKVTIIEMFKSMINLNSKLIECKVTKKNSLTGDKDR